MNIWIRRLLMVGVALSVLFAALLVDHYTLG